MFENVSDNGDKYWYVPGFLWIEGGLHRLDGPALEYADGYNSWRIHGRSFNSIDNLLDIIRYDVVLNKRFPNKRWG